MNTITVVVFVVAALLIGGVIGAFAIGKPTIYHLDEMEKASVISQQKAVCDKAITSATKTQTQELKDCKERNANLWDDYKKVNNQQLDRVKLLEKYVKDLNTSVVVREFDLNKMIYDFNKSLVDNNYCR